MGLWDAAPFEPAGPPKAAAFALLVPTRLADAGARLLASVSAHWATSRLGTHAPAPGAPPRGVVTFDPSRGESVATAAAALARRLASSRPRPRPPPVSVDGEPEGGLLVYVACDGDGLDAMVEGLAAAARTLAEAAPPRTAAGRAVAAATLAPLPPSLLTDERSGTARALAFAGYCRLRPRPPSRRPPPRGADGRRPPLPPPSLAHDPLVGVGGGGWGDADDDSTPPPALHAAYVPLGDGRAAAAWTDAAGGYLSTAIVDAPALTDGSSDSAIDPLPAAVLAATARIKSAAAAAAVAPHRAPTTIVVARVGDPSPSETAAWQALLARRVVGAAGVAAVAVSLDPPLALASAVDGGCGDTHSHGPLLVTEAAGDTAPRATIIFPPAPRSAGRPLADGEAGTARAVSVMLLATATAGAAPPPDPAATLQAVVVDLVALGTASAATEAAAAGGRGWLSPGAHTASHVAAAARHARLMAVLARVGGG